MPSDKARCLELERLILDYKKFDQFMPHARLLQEFWENKGWQALGYAEVMDWLTKRYPENYVNAYRLVDISKMLGAQLSDPELEMIGVSKCGELARLARRGGTLNTDTIQSAKDMSYKDFKRYVGSLLLKNGAPIDFGELLNPRFRGLQHAPVNELGVVYLFGIVSDELGFVIEKIQPGFPDCEAKERVRTSPEVWRRVRIEFEFRSGNFDHAPEGADIVVCWEHNWPECPVKRVIELKSEIRKLPPSVTKLANA